MATRSDLVDWLEQALQESGGRGTIVDLCRQVWERHEQDLRNSGDLFFTWQYEIRWAAHKLRESGTMLPAPRSPKGLWILAGR